MLVGPTGIGLDHQQAGAAGSIEVADPDVLERPVEHARALERGSLRHHARPNGQISGAAAHVRARATAPRESVAGDASPQDLGDAIASALEVHGLLPETVGRYEVKASRDLALARGKPHHTAVRIGSRTCGLDSSGIVGHPITDGAVLEHGVDPPSLLTDF